MIQATIRDEVLNAQNASQAVIGILQVLRSEERRVFQAFYDVCPNFAHRPVSWTDGANPPDVLCADSAGNLVGVELGEWLNEAQIRSNKRLERWEDSYLKVIRSQDEAPPKNYGPVWVGPKPDVELSASDGESFRRELLRLVRQVDQDWPSHREWDSPQGYTVREFSAYPVVARYLTDLHFHPQGRPGIIPGIRWIRFPYRGGSYSPQDAVDALLELLRDKTAKYSDLHAKQSLTELYLIAYYNKAALYNSPYLAPGLGLPEVASIAAAEVANNPRPFQKIFLFNATKPGLEVFQLWPRTSAP
jgi:hypothetical protein